MQLTVFDPNIRARLTVRNDYGRLVIDYPLTEPYPQCVRAAVTELLGWDQPEKQGSGTHAGEPKDENT